MIKKIAGYILGGIVVVMVLGYLTAMMLTELVPAILTRDWGRLWNPGLLLKPAVWIYGAVVTVMVYMLYLVFHVGTVKRAKRLMKAKEDSIESSLENSRFMTDKEKDDYMKPCWIADTLRLPQEDKDQIFIRMVFNYVAGISDDHNKNISFIMDKTGAWRLSPAYDVMFTANAWENSSAHIHSMGVMGKRSALTTRDFVNFAEDFVEEPEKKILQVFML